MAYKRDKQFGDKGEALMKEWLEKRELTERIEDVSDDPYYQKKDIDFLVYQKTGKTMKVDVKYDTLIDKTGNVFIELISNDKKKTPGNFIYSKADLFLYVFAKSKRVLIIPLKEAREYIYKNLKKFKSVSVPNYDYNGKILYHSKGRLVKYTELLENVDYTDLLPL
ncbi:MAG: hypothetical protein GX963_10305 [Bacteroidales bacterium]|nr:hypothetical protein [Bacteroidales bacterium]